MYNKILPKQLQKCGHYFETGEKDHKFIEMSKKISNQPIATSNSNPFLSVDNVSSIDVIEMETKNGVKTLEKKQSVTQKDSSIQFNTNVEVVKGNSRNIKPGYSPFNINDIL